MRRNLAATIVTLVFVSACGGAAAHDPAADAAAIGKVRDSYASAFKAGDAGALAALYTADAQVMNNLQATVTGTQGIEAANKNLADLASRDIVVTPEKTDISGDMAYDRGTYKMTLTPKTGAPTVEEGRYLVVLKRQPDGSWKVAENIGNLAAAPVAAPAAAPAKAPAKGAKKAPTKKK